MSDKERIAELEAGLLEALMLAGHYGPEKAHTGFCTPESGCDAMCQEAAIFGEAYCRLSALLPHENVQP